MENIENDSLYKEMVRAAKRDNNKLRSYLIVNPVLCKHIPASPEKFFNKAKDLADKFKNIAENEPVLVIAFAETATALGACVCSNLNKDSYFITTTRENYPDEECLYFSEVHSHAASQKLYIKGLDNILKKIRHIVFVEDEITTGNTIINLINVLKEKFSNIETKKIWVLSFINGMDSKSLERFHNNHITPLYLLKTDNEIIAEQIKNISLEGSYFQSNNNEISNSGIFHFKKYINPRFAVKFSEYEKSIEEAAKIINSHINILDNDILVLGTEECMYPGLYISKLMQKNTKNILFHATTRSPIMTGNHKGYPLNTRYSLESFYEKERVTYIYNLKKYSSVIIVSDGINNKKGIYSLVNALKIHNNDNIFIFMLGDN